MQLQRAQDMSKSFMPQRRSNWQYDAIKKGITLMSLESEIMMHIS